MTKTILSDLKSKKLSVMFLDDDDSPCVVSEWVSTGCLALDAIMGGGLPVGRLVEIFGDPSTGKSLIASQVAAIAQQMDATVLYIDTETAVSKDMMAEVGVDVSKLLYASPDTVEEVFTIIHETIDSKTEIDPDGLLVIIWDSISATSIQQEMEAEYGKATMGRHAGLISQGLRKITRKIAKSSVVFLTINQVREKIGVMFGDNTATFGGKAVSFHSSIRIHLHMSGKIKDSDKHIIGINVRAVVEKNKLAVPYREAILPIYFGNGIDDGEASFDMLKETGIITTHGNSYVITIDDKESSFKKSSWNKFYNDNYDSIEKIVTRIYDTSN
jgi:recombination protein RecA